MKKRRAASDARAALQEREAWVGAQIKKDRGSSDMRVALRARAAWRAEVREQVERRLSLLWQIEQASRAGDRVKLARLEDQRKATLPPPARLPISKQQRSLLRQAGEAEREGDFQLADKLYREAAVEFPKDHEWNKTVPRRLRSATGLAAWGTALSWRTASESEKRHLAKRVGKSRDFASDALFEILRHLKRENVEFFSKLGIAFYEIGRSFTEGTKERLLWYRGLRLYHVNLNRATRGQPRHTIVEIQQIVDPYRRITPKTFGNMVRELKVPHLPAKPGPK